MVTELVLNRTVKNGSHIYTLDLVVNTSKYIVLLGMPFKDTVVNL